MEMHKICGQVERGKEHELSGIRKERGRLLDAHCAWMGAEGVDLLDREISRRLAVKSGFSGPSQITAMEGCCAPLKEPKKFPCCCCCYNTFSS